MRRLVAACLVVTALLTGCGTGESSSHLRVSDTLVPATPADSPPTATTPAGTVLPAPPADLTVLDPATNTLALAGAGRPKLTLFDTRTPNKPPRTIPLPGPAAGMRKTGKATLLVSIPDNDLVVRVNTTTGTLDRIPVTGGPVDAVEIQGELVVALREPNTVVTVDNGKVQHTADGFQEPSRLIRQGDEVLVLDSLATSLTPVTIDTGDKGAALRAGEGSTHAVKDRFGRILTIDTRGNELMAFSTDPLIMRQRSPVDGHPYGLTYDASTDLAWTTLTASNELVAYDVTAGQPIERHRLPTVRQPNSVTVDPATGTVYVASATGQGLQVVSM
ncbi:DNA-binding beta-propeller fold protein YncE [Saccharopolyspora lacisalsi]|uniref:DNA-binding beta-propeller fold protein YncE n=1 Tax=Halosaccharopolyspora lacisalsi TaxID=1000566 RepID=A0A839DZ22_9PSEU|nr:hypothetical protein [Halosaccharopolyspora lacisalsi]MBA8824635.1 DNA-binding beta-propeller fold protein YncE [Halosaccharopolyspora lacisalsi]